MWGASSAVRRNVELKARMESLAEPRRIARELTGGPPTIERQVDTYFHCRHGRLKLRRINDAAAVLIGYSRPDESSARLSRYRLVPAPDPDALEATLAAALGVERVVEKVREIFLYENVRIHLDEVVGLGAFLELEAVLTADQTTAEGEEIVDRLRRRFGIEPSALIATSYRDLA